MWGAILTGVGSIISGVGNAMNGGGGGGQGAQQPPPAPEKLEGLEGLFQNMGFSNADAKTYAGWLKRILLISVLGFGVVKIIPFLGKTLKR